MTYGALRIRVANANLIVNNQSGFKFARQDYYIRITNQDDGSSVYTRAKGPVTTPSFDATLTFPPAYYNQKTILVEVMDKLRFGADVPISHTLVELKPSTFEAGKKGTLFEWFGLEHCNEETNGGEVSLSFAFENLPEPVEPDPIVLSKPWYLTAEGLYQIGVKKTWERLEQYDRVKPITSKTNEIILSLISRKGGTSSSVDGFIAEKLSSFDRVVDEIIPTAAELVPFTNLKVKVEPPTIAVKKVQEDPETQQPSPEAGNRRESARKKTMAQRVSGYPSLLGASVSRRVTTPRKYVERENVAA